MIWIRVFLSICALLAWPSLNPAQAEGLPNKVVSTLQERTQALSHLRFSWQRFDKEQIFCSLSPAQMKDIRKKELEGTEADYRKQGVTDEARIKRDAMLDTQSLMMALQGGSVDYSNVWSFQRDGSATLASGTIQTFNGFIRTSRQFYENNLALAVADKSSFNGKELSGRNPVVWRTTGDSISYPVSSSASLDLSPEHLVFLLVSNPLSLRGLDWKLQSQSPTFLVLNASFVEEHTNCGIKMTLAVRNGFAPSEITVQSGHTVERYTASSFRPYKDTWISDRVTYSKDAPGFVHEAQVWKLKNVVPSSPIELKIAGHEFVRDFRLVGSDLSSIALDKAGMRRDKRFGEIVYYRWPGHFPSDKEVEQTLQKQHPGESSPDVGQTGAGNPSSAANMIGSTLPFAGGVLCLAGGVWMFKQRKAN